MPKQVKTIVAVVVALFGLGLAVRGLLPTRSERTDAPKPRLVTADGTVPTPVRRERPPADLRELGWVEDEGATYELARVRNDDDAAALAQAIGTRIDASSAGAGASVATLLGAMLTEQGDLGSAFASLGSGANEQTTAFDAVLGPLLEHASADPAAIQIGKPDEPPTAIGGLSVNRSVNREEGQDPVDITTLSASFESQFPGIVDEDARGELLEVKIPMRSKGSDADGPDSWLTVVLRQKGDQWQPATASLATTDPGVMDHVRKAIAELQRANAANEPTGG